MEGKVTSSLSQAKCPFPNKPPISKAWTSCPGPSLPPPGIRAHCPSLGSYSRHAGHLCFCGWHRFPLLQTPGGPGSAHSQEGVGAWHLGPALREQTEWPGPEQAQRETGKATSTTSPARLGGASLASSRPLISPISGRLARRDLVLPPPALSGAVPFYFPCPCISPCAHRQPASQLCPPNWGVTVGILPGSSRGRGPFPGPQCGRTLPSWRPHHPGHPRFHPGGAAGPPPHLFQQHS